MDQPKRQRGFRAKALPPLFGMAVASLGWVFHERDKFGLGPSGAASNACLIIGIFWSSVLTAWALQRGAPSLYRRCELAVFGLVIGFLCAAGTWFVPMAIRYFL